MPIPSGYRTEGATAIVQMETGDIVAKTHNGQTWAYEAHVKGGSSWFCLPSLDAALKLIQKARGQ